MFCFNCIDRFFILWTFICGEIFALKPSIYFKSIIKRHLQYSQGRFKSGSYGGFLSRANSVIIHLSCCPSLKMYSSLKKPPKEGLFWWIWRQQLPWTNCLPVFQFMLQCFNIWTRILDTEHLYNSMKGGKTKHIDIAKQNT